MGSLLHYRLCIHYLVMIKWRACSIRFLFEFLFPFYDVLHTCTQFCMASYLRCRRSLHTLQLKSRVNDLWRKFCRGCFNHMLRMRNKWSWGLMNCFACELCMWVTMKPNLNHPQNCCCIKGPIVLIHRTSPNNYCATWQYYRQVIQNLYGCIYQNTIRLGQYFVSIVGCNLFKCADRYIYWVSVLHCCSLGKVCIMIIENCI